MTIFLLLSLLVTPDYVRAEAGDTRELHFTILHTNDLHSALIPHSPAVDYHPEKANPTIGGLARLATAVDEIRAGKEEPVLLLDAGDFLAGSAFAWLTLQGYAAELTIMQEIGYDVVIIGNHEYDYGPDVLAQYLIEAGYPEAHATTLVLASNAVAPPDYPLAAPDLLRTSEILELENGLRLGVFGLMGEDAVSLIGDPGGMEFLDEHAVARQAVQELKAQGAHVIVAITHSGVRSDRALAREVPGINVIVGGHCHTALHRPILQGDTLIVQAGSLGEYLGQLELAYNTGTGKLRVRNENNHSPFLIPIDDTFACHPGINSLVEKYALILNEHISEVTDGEFEDIMNTVARSDFVLSNQPRLNETPLGNFISDAMRLVTEAIIGEKVVIAVTANGVIRKSVSPGTMEHSRGNISFYEIADAISLGYGTDGYGGLPIVSFYVSGEEMRRMLEMAVLLEQSAGDTFFLQFSGIRYSYNPTNAVLFTVPFIDLPIPTARAVVGAELYVGEGVEPANGEGYVPLRRGDERLYRVATDYYILSFLPWVTDLLPWLEIVPKNDHGEPVPPDTWQDLIVRCKDGHELKVWQTVVQHAANQPPGADGLPRIADYYANTAGRINRVWTFPLVGWLYLLLAAVLALIAFLFVRRRRLRRSLKPSPP
ncbi:MAG: bifunctional metallophosphatase/5'-nucleotidase [Dehalococcoidia bacterium]|nr:bifunctional metallophosphatase/5'-nucleotidase [Dehalococcoidia bacterium]